MFSIPTLLVLVPALPLAATLATAALGKKVLREQSHWPAVAGIGLSFLAALLLLFQVRAAVAQADAGPVRIGYEEVVRLWTWANVEGAGGMEPGSPGPSPPRQIALMDFAVEVALRADPLTAVMLVTVTFVSFLVAVYSIGYMHEDPGYWRFFAYIALFVFSMTMLVSVSNFLMLYIFWEAVGLCSYLLIGFWYQKPEAAAAGKKAFLVNRIGDFGFALGVFLIWTTYGTLNFHDTIHDTGLTTMGVLGQSRLAEPGLFVAGGIATAICLLLLLGACGKSAQFPLHVWLPDAMEGPTPVSALIHAATMVTAGIYMIARCAPLFHASGDAFQAVALIGGFTALLASAIAVTQTDLKRILAYSTISQLGYMFLGLGAGTLPGITAGMFHLFTHAFFKALLFLGAGSVMHAMGGVIDIRRFGGLRHRMPTTHWTFLIGCLALAAFPGFSGFFSKDEILVALHENSLDGPSPALYHILYLAASATAFLTAFYTFRAFILTFYGPERIPHEAGDHAHESPNSMTLPLVILAIFSAFVGAWFFFTHGFSEFLAHTPSLAYPAMHTEEAAHAPSVHAGVMVASALVAVAGIGLAWLLYLRWPKTVDRLTAAMDAVGLYRLSFGKFYIDQAYHVLVVRPLAGLAWASYWFDRYVVDGLVDLIGLAPRGAGAVLRSLQSGMVQFYALAMVLGVLVLIVALLV
ncbi:MAG: NADH-quinone oxidoreductase subunit L [Pirellulales bacterium]|nr:NADH-quinone oxidoreductase subunit L [Pirellulales bacterium]